MDNNERNMLDILAIHREEHYSMHQDCSINFISKLWMLRYTMVLIMWSTTQLDNQSKYAWKVLWIPDQEDGIQVSTR